MPACASGVYAGLVSAVIRRDVIKVDVAGATQYAGGTASGNGRVALSGYASSPTDTVVITQYTYVTDGSAHTWTAGIYDGTSLRAQIVGGADADTTFSGTDLDHQVPRDDAGAVMAFGFTSSGKDGDGRLTLHIEVRSAGEAAT